MDADIQNRLRRIRFVAFDFDGVFTDNMVYVQQDGSEAVRCFRESQRYSMDEDIQAGNDEYLKELMKAGYS